VELLLGAAPYLLGLLAVAVPILLHLRPRKRNIVIRFAATRFLQPVMKRTAKRLRLQNLVLMALRIAVIMLFALAFTMPLLRSLKAARLSFDEKSSVIVIVDASFSMRYGPQDKTQFDRAKAMGDTILGALTDRDEGAVILAGPTAEDLPPGVTRQIGLLREGLAEARPTCGVANLRLALEKAGRLLADNEKPSRHVVLLTDLQRTGFRQLQANRLGADVLQGASLTIVDMGRKDAANTALVAARLRTTAPALGMPLEFESEARHFGPGRAETLCSLVFDGRPGMSQKLTVSPGVPSASELRHTFHKPGLHTGFVELDSDLLPIDNRAYLSVRIRQAAPVLCVDGDLSAVAGRQETVYFRTALWPKVSNEQQRRLAKPVVCSPEELEGVRVDDYRVILLANVADLSAGAVARLEGFVHGGGSLLLFVGDRVKPEAYNARFWSEEKGEGLLPAKLGGRIGRADRRQPLRLAEINYGHPMLAPFRDNRMGELGKAEFYQALGVSRQHLAKGTKILARYGDGSPAILERTIGRGRVVLWTSSADTDWTDLPTCPVFVPLVHEMVRYLSIEAYEQKRYRVGDVIRIPLDIGAADVAVQVRMPNGKSVAATVRTVGDRRLAEFRRTDLPGLYELAIRQGERTETKSLAVNLDPAESDLTRIDGEALKECFHPDQHLRVTDSGNLADALAEGRGGHQMWIWLLYLALAVYIAEALYAGRLTRETDTSEGSE